eukprot:9516576-Alexandrium_andersonii.AAC.1
MSASLVGSEMCIRDRPSLLAAARASVDAHGSPASWAFANWGCAREVLSCLLYTSDAADDM